MTELSQIAFEFASHCLKWRKPEPSGNPCVELMWMKAPAGTRFLRFTDLNAVMEAAREWCKKQELWWKLGDSDYPISNGVYVSVGMRYGAFEQLADQYADGPCYALLAACVEAAKKLEVGNG